MGRENIDKPNIIRKVYLVGPYALYIFLSKVFAKRIGNGATYSMSLIKRLVYKSLETDFEESLRLAGPAQDIARKTNDHKEGIESFIQKRSPKFSVNQ